MRPEEPELIGDAFWAELAPRVLHPVQVQIIEALRWIDQPLSATDLRRVCERQPIERHLQRLARLDAVALTSKSAARTAMTQFLYRLAKVPRA